MNTKIFISIIIISCTLSLKGQVQYQRIYDNYETGFDVKKLGSNNYIMLCEFLDIDFERKPALLKIGESGNIIWEKKLELSSWARFLYITNNKDILIYTQNITLLDSTGSIKWRLNPSEQINNYSSAFFFKVFENSQDTSFVFVSVDGDFLSLDSNGNVLNYHVNTSDLKPEIKDVYRDNYYNYWLVGYKTKEIEPVGEQITGMYVAKLDKNYSFIHENTYNDLQAAVAVNKGLYDGMVVLVDAFSNSKILHISDDGIINKIIVNKDKEQENYINLDCSIEQIAQNKYLLFGNSVRLVNDNKMLKESISIGNQFIHSDSLFLFVGRVQDSGEINVKYNASLSKEIFDFSQANAIENSFYNEMQIRPNPVTSAVYLDIPNAEYFYTITNINGVNIESGKGNSKSINVSRIPTGMYILKVKTKDEYYISKFIKTTY